MHVLGEPVGRQIVPEAILLGLTVDDRAGRSELITEPDIVDEAGDVGVGFASADAAGDQAAAVHWYEKATELQPENPDTWFELGFFHAIATGDQCAAYQALNRSYTLDPMSRRWTPGGPLDVARKAVNEGACERSP